MDNLSPFQETQDDLFQDEEAQLRGDYLPSHCFECIGEINSYLNNSTHGDLPIQSLVRSGSINALFYAPSHHASILNKIENLELFNNNFNAGLALTEKHQILFQVARKWFLMLESDALKINSIGTQTLRTDNQNYFKIRQQLCLFFSFLQSTLFSIPANDDYKWLMDDVIPSLYPLLKQWRSLLRGFCKLPYNVVRNCPSRLGNKCELPSYHLFHCHLEMRWYHTSVLLALSHISKQAEASQNLEKDLSLFIVELVSIAEGVFVSSTPHGTDRILLMTPFPCSCVREMWVMLQVLADKLKSNNVISKPFWGLLEQELQVFLRPQRIRLEGHEVGSQITRQATLEKNVNVDQPSLCFWLFFHLSKLYGYSENGLYMDILRSPPVPEAVTLLDEILKSMLPQNEDIKEEKLREVVQVLMSFPEFWPTGISPILILWEIFLRRINSFFTLSSEPLGNMAVVSRKVSEFALQVKQYLSLPTNRGETENSYNLFLRLLGTQLVAMSADQEVQERAWKQLKGRIYPKFQSTRLQTMSELGLHHLSSLMLTLALSIDLNEVGDRLQEMLSDVPKTSEKGKRQIVWRTHLTLILLRTEKGLSLSLCVEPLQELLTETSNKLTLFSTTEMDLFRLYIDALHDIAEACQRPQSLHLLIGKWIPRYLEICQTTDVCRTLDAIQALANKLGSFGTQHFGGNSGEQELYVAFKVHILPYLMQQSSTPNAPTQKIGDLAVSIALASPDNEFVQLFNHFVSSESVNVRITARFICQILPNVKEMERVKSKVNNYPNAIIQAWFKCCLLSNDNRFELENLTKAVTKLPQFVALCGGETDLLLSSSEPVEFLAHQLDSRFQAMETIREKQQLKEQTIACVGRIDKVAEAALKHGKLPTATVSRLYQTIGILVQRCAPLLYSKGTVNCLLKGIVSHLLLPMSLIKDADFPADNALKDTLPMYLQGIVRLGVKHDIYIARTIREIVMHYIPRLSPAAQGADHPLMECLTLGTELSSAILDGIKVSFFTKKLRNLPHGGIQALQLLQSVLLIRDYDSLLVRELVNILLEPLLNQMLCLEDNSQDKKEVANTIKEIVNSSAFKDMADIQKLFDNCMKKLFGFLSFHMDRVFRILMWLVKLRRSLLVPSLPDLRTELGNPSV
ncbi:hypothetical protein B566_EDAN011911 [Ephemera danica]|nr:hypothetical protein B566_EDAN011911 [Ephemera danica]